MTATELDPRVKAANIKAAARMLFEATARREAIEDALADLEMYSSSAATVTRKFSLRFQRSCAERAERHALAYARAAGLQDLIEYPMIMDGVMCSVFLDGPSVTLGGEE